MSDKMNDSTKDLSAAKAEEQTREGAGRTAAAAGATAAAHATSVTADVAQATGTAASASTADAAGTTAEAAHATSAAADAEEGAWGEDAGASRVGAPRATAASAGTSDGSTAASGAAASAQQPARMRKTTLPRILMIVLLAVCIAIPLATFTRGANLISPIDNRELQNFPSRSEDAPLHVQAESYTADRIGLRAQMIGTYSLINDRAFHVMTHPLYEYGNDDYVFFRFTDETLDQDFMADYATYVKRMQDYCEERGVPFLYVISPEKTRIYPEEIPSDVGFQDNSSYYLKPLFDLLGVNYIDLADGVMAAKDAGIQVFNQQYDAGHWNTEGMYAGTQQIIAKLNDMGLDVDPIDLADYQKVYTHQTSLPASVYPIDTWTYKYQHLLEGNTGASQVRNFGANLELDSLFRDFWYWQNPTQADAPNLLMFQGSYFNTQGTMLYNQFDHAALIHDYQNVFDLPYYFELFNPDVVIFENADYTVTDSYYDPDALVDTDLPAPFSTYANLPVQACGGLASLYYDNAATVENFTIPWTDNFDISAAYVKVNGKIYDAQIRDSAKSTDLIHTKLKAEDARADAFGMIDESAWGFLNDQLNSTEMTAYRAAEDDVDGTFVHWGMLRSDIGDANHATVYAVSADGSTMYRYNVRLIPYSE